MTNREINRHSIIKKLLDKEINGTNAAELLKLSVRQVRRLKAKVKQIGARALIHASRGKQSNRKIPEEERMGIEDFLPESNETYTDNVPF